MESYIFSKNVMKFGLKACYDSFFNLIVGIKF